MKIRDYFLLGLKNNLDLKRHWVNSLISIVTKETKPEDYPYRLIYEGEVLYFIDPETQAKVYIEEYIPGRELIHFRDQFDLNPGDIINYHGSEPRITTYGNVFVNHLTLVQTGCAAIVEFQFGTINFGKLESFILEQAVDDDAEVLPPGKIRIAQYVKFAEYALNLIAYSAGLVTSSSEKSITGHPDRTRIRDEWVNANAHRLTDPTAIAELNDILDALDKTYLEGDSSAPYYVSSNKIIGARRMMYYTAGADAGFGDGATVDFIPKALDEGTDLTKLTVLNNSTRVASYSRGAETALGGESTKTIYRMVGNVRVVEPDCGSTVGINTLVSIFNFSDLIGYSYLTPQGMIKITRENVQPLMGQYIDLRSPGTCKTSIGDTTQELGRGKNICAVCAGDVLGENPNGIPAAAAGVGGVFLNNSLKKMHNTEMKIAKWNYLTKIT